MRRVSILPLAACGPLPPISGRTTAFGHPGAGGPIGFADLGYGLAVDITKNMLRTSFDPTQTTAVRVAQRIREVLRIPMDGTIISR